MTLVPASSHGGGSGNTTAEVVASGKVLPVADPAGVTVDATTYTNPIAGVGKLTTLVFPADTVSLALAVTGDAFPRMIYTVDGGDGIYWGTGASDPVNAGNIYLTAGRLSIGGPSGAATNGNLRLGAVAAASDQAPALNQVSPLFTLTTTIPTVSLASGTAAQISTTRDVETHTPVTFNPGVATTATCTVEISPDNSTFRTLAVITKPVGTVFDGEIEDVTVRVPAGWYLRLTVNAQASLGTTVYY